MSTEQELVFTLFLLHTFFCQLHKKVNFQLIYHTIVYKKNYISCKKIGMPKNPIIITADYREKPSGIPDLLLQNGVVVNFIQLKVGDYVINNEIVVERKSAEDFVQSLVSGRLFGQCASLSKTCLRPLLLLEGNPYKTAHKIDQQAIKGALLSIVTAWQVPVIHSKNHQDSAAMLLILSKQTMSQSHLVRFSSYKPKRIKNHRLRFLQGLPKIGAVTASRLLEHFGSIEAVVNADIKALQEVKGVGKIMAVKIKAFLAGNNTK